jgi:hypothetical protein
MMANLLLGKKVFIVSALKIEETLLYLLRLFLHSSCNHFHIISIFNQ